jgi:hypothetical protein
MHYYGAWCVTTVWIDSTVCVYSDWHDSPSDSRGGGGGDCAGGIFVVGYSAYKKEKLERICIGIIKK